MHDESPPDVPCVLATDLDGTLIPLDEDAHARDLAILRDELADSDVALVFVTRRHLASIEQVMEERRLPRPDWIVGDVGTSLYEPGENGGWRPVAEYVAHLEGIVETLPVDELRREIERLDGIRIHEPEKLGPFKLSFYLDAADLDERVGHVRDWLHRHDTPWTSIASVDPFTGDGLLDLLPRGVSKAYALRWWAQHVGRRETEIVFAGDSGNDLAAFEAGYHTIVVGNADRAIARRVHEHHRRQGWSNRLHLPAERATSAVLAGARWFGLFPGESNAGDALGATPVSAALTRFRVWAPARRSVEVRIEGDDGARSVPLEPEMNGYFSAIVDDAGPGTRYRYRLDDEIERPDPYSRYQPDGVHGPSIVVDADAFPWQDADWQGIAPENLVVHEVHIGTWTPDGTFRAAIDRLDEIVELGVTAVEVMPVAQTSGRWNWGYDGVNLFAPRNTYGTPDDMRAFVDACHARGLGVILDVVYNHVGPEGNYLADFGPYASPRHHTPWGDALNFDGPDAAPVRRFVVDNALRWLDEYHLDGLRLDAVHFMQDDSEPTILDELREAVSHYAAGVRRTIHLIAETNAFDEHLARSRSTGRANDLLWCDDFAHSAYAIVAPETRLTAREYESGTDLAEVLRHGYVYEGAAMRRVAPSDRERLSEHGPAHESLLVGLQTHDLVGNEPNGRRLHELASADVQRVAAALAILSPWTPLIFMGEETAAASPFHFFTDFEDERLRRAVERGRRSEHPGAHDVSPIDPLAFERSQLGPPTDATIREWYRQLLAIRRDWTNNGWLRSDNLRVEHPAASSMFRLRYPIDSEREASVLVGFERDGQLSEDGSDAVVLLEWTGSPDGPVVAVAIGPRSDAGSGECDNRHGQPWMKPL